MLTSLGVRHVRSPQSLLLLEPHTIFASAGHNGPEQYATRIDLAPIAAPSLREAAAPRAPNTHHLSVGADTVQIIHPEGVESAEADPAGDPVGLRQGQARPHIRCEGRLPLAVVERTAAYAEASGRPWLIVSAKYGLVVPSARIAPYDVTLAEMPAGERAAWGENTADALQRHYGSVSGMTFEIHAGRPTGTRSNHR